MIVIAIHFPKGGVGKSTTAWALASLLGQKHRILAIDLDPQATLTNALLAEAPTLGALDVLTKTVAIPKADTPAAPAFGPNVRVLAATSALANLEQQTASDFDRPYLLRDALDSDINADIVVIDTPPGGSLFTINALVAATHVLSPLSLDALSWDQIPAFEKLLDQVRRGLNPGLDWLGILPTRYDSRRKLDNEVLTELRTLHALVHSPITESVRIKETMARGAPASDAVTALFFDAAVASILKAVARE